MSGEPDEPLAAYAQSAFEVPGEVDRVSEHYAVAWLVARPFVLIYIAFGSIMEVPFGIRLRRSDDSDGTDSAGRDIDELQVTNGTLIKYFWRCDPMPRTPCGAFPRG